ncbi:MAG: prolyl oligopeptidase family serine peptidase [Bryobacteraceae bacterium]
MVLRNSTLITLACLSVASAGARAQAPPPSRKQPIVDVYHGIKVVDDYRWLEDGQSQAVKQWVASQNAYSRTYFDKLPQLSEMRNQLFAYANKQSISYSRLRFRGGKFFALKSDPAKQQAVLVTFASVDDLSGERVLVDPNTSSKQGRLSIDWFVPSLDGRIVAVAMSEGGSEDASLYVYETASAKQVGEIVPRVSYPTGGGSLAWLADGKRFLYTRYPQGRERPPADANFYQQIYLHKMGSPAASDEYILGRDFPRIAETELDSSPDGKYILAAVANGDGGQFEHFLRTENGDWTQLTHFEDRIVGVSIDSDGALYLLSRNKAPRGNILRLPAGDLKLDDAKVIVPEGPASIETPPEGGSDQPVLPTATRLYVKRIDGGPNQITVYSHLGKALGKVPLPAVSSTDNMLSPGGDDLLVRAEGYTSPATVYRFNASGQLRATALRVNQTIDLSEFEVKRAFAKSKDGTSVPMSIIHKKGLKHDGTAPTLIYGYGGYGISITPKYGGGTLFYLWLDEGGSLVETNLRGGGEYGEDWHTAGNLTRKQNVFDDFAACTEYLIQEKYSSPEHIVALGGSNGGLLMGAELTQHPELFRAVVSFVGIYDMLRIELDPNGAFNTTEFGSVKNRQQFDALYAYSPYHRVKDGMAYPAVLFVTGDNDGRVNPANSRKMTARLQAATSSKYPIFLRTSSNAGHGIGTALSERINQQADVYSFIFDQLGLRYEAPRSSGKRSSAQPVGGVVRDSSKAAAIHGNPLLP